MAIKRSHEYVCFRRDPTHGPVLLMAGTRHRSGRQPQVKRCAQNYLFHYVISGRGAVAFPNGKEAAVTAGDWFFAFPGQTIRYCQEPDAKWRYYWVGLEGESVERILARAGVGPEIGIWQGEPDKEAEGLFESILTSLDAEDHTADLEASMTLMRLLCHLIRHTPDENRLATVSERRAPGLAVEDACRFINEHFMDGIGVASVADYAGLERSYFSKLFATATGVTVRDYLSQIRLTRAQSLLKNSHRSIAEIATEVGYLEARTFSHFFKRRAGMSPQHWRDANSGDS